MTPEKAEEILLEIQKFPCVETVQKVMQPVEEQLNTSKKIMLKLVNAIRVLSDPKVELADCDSFLAEADKFLEGFQNG